MSYLDTARRVMNESRKETKKRKKSVPACSECGAAISADEPETWWGTDCLHHACGLRAWRRHWGDGQTAVQ